MNLFLFTPAEWRNISLKFSNKWNVHHCCETIEGKPMQISKPNQNGSLFYNCEGYITSMVFALVDADYEFIWANYGGNGCLKGSYINKIHFRKRVYN